MSYSRNNSQDLIYNSYSNTYELASKTYTLTIIPEPSDATVTFTGGTVSGNSVSGLYNVEVTYTVSKQGFITRTGTYILNHDESRNIPLSAEADKTFFGGGGGKPTYLNIQGAMITDLFAWYDGTNTFYTINEKPSVYEQLYNNQGNRVTTYKISGKKGNIIIIKKIADNTTSEFTYSKTRNKKNVTITNGVFYKNGGGGSGGRGEDWTDIGMTHTNKGGAGGGYFWLDPSNTGIYTITGRDAGVNQNGEDQNMFPNVISGKGGASGINHGATVTNPKTSNKQGGGSSGANSNINTGGDPYTAYYGSGGGGAGGDEDASGGKAGKGSTTYVANTTGDNGYNYHTTPTTVPTIRLSNQKSEMVTISNLGRGGVPYTNPTTNVNGKNGWLYIYKFENVYQVFDMGQLATEPQDNVIDAGKVEWPIDASRTMDGGTDFDHSNYLDAGQITNVSIWKNCGSITDTSVNENIKLGNI